MKLWTTILPQEDRLKKERKKEIRKNQLTKSTTRHKILSEELAVDVNNDVSQNSHCDIENAELKAPGVKTTEKIK